MLGGPYSWAVRAPVLLDYAFDYKDVFSFSLLVLILDYSPSGLLGKLKVENVYMSQQLE